MATPELPEGFIEQEMADPAELMLGPFAKHMTSNITLLWPEQRHTNLSGIVHGGVLMTFADFTFCSSGMRETDDEICVTISLNTDFVDNTSPGDWIRGEAAITRKTRNLVFGHGGLFSGQRLLVTFNGIGKRVRRP